MTRATRGMIGTVMARITFVSLLPSAVTTASARISSGNEISTSINRSRSRSTFPPKYALTTPKGIGAQPMHGAGRLELLQKTGRVRIERRNHPRQEGDREHQDDDDGAR